MDEQTYLTHDMAYDLDETDEQRMMREALYKILDLIGEGGLQQIVTREPGRYGRKRGEFEYSGTTPKFRYKLVVTWPVGDSS